MICKYCGKSITAKDGICTACKRSVKQNEISFEDVYSSSSKEIEKAEEDILFDDANTTNDVKTVLIKPAQKASARSKKTTGFIFAGILLALIVVVGLYFGLFKTSTSKIKSELKAGKYDSAYSLFIKSFDKSGSSSLNSMLKDRLKESYDEYRNGTRAYESVLEEYKTIKKMGIAEILPDIDACYKKLDLMKASKKYYTEGQKQYSNNNYSAAITAYKKVLADDSDYPDAQKKLTQSIQSYRNTSLSEAATYVSDGDYTTAIKTLKTALVILEKDAIVEKRITEYTRSESTKGRQEVLDTADKFAYREDYAGAIRTINEAIAANPALKSDNVINNYLKNYLGSYEKALGAKIDKLISTGNYTEAGSTFKLAEQLLGVDNATVSENKTKLAGKIPEYLDDLTASTEESWKFNNGVAVDSFGTDRSGEDNYINISTNSTATYILQGTYKTFKCKVAASKGIDESVKCRLRVTATVGGEYIYRECEVSAAKETQDLSLDIHGCTAITFSVSGEGASIIMYDAVLQN